MAALKTWLVSRKRGFEMKRRLLSAGPQQLAIAHEFRATEQHEAVLATAHHWLASLVIVHEGQLGFRDARGFRPMTAERFLLYLPAGALVRMPLWAARVETVGISAAHSPIDWPTVPVAVPCTLTPDSVLEQQAVADVLRQASPAAHRIDAEWGHPARLRRLRTALYQQALRPSPVSRVAQDFDLSLPVFSRTFNAAFGLSPRDYCQRVRVHAAVVSLLGGLSIAHAALDSGWQDLSRFYRQFRLATGHTPGRYRGAGTPPDRVK